MLPETSTAQTGYPTGDILIMIDLDRFIIEDAPMGLVVKGVLDQFAENLVVCDTECKQMFKKNSLNFA